MVSPRNCASRASSIRWADFTSTVRPRYFPCDSLIPGTSRHAAVEPDHRAGGEAREIAREVERRGGDLLRASNALGRCGRGAVGLLAPGRGDVGPEGAALDGVDPHLGPEL